MYTTGLDSNWYQVNISDLTAEMVDYFNQRALRDNGRYTKIKETTITWSTQFESAKTIILLGVEHTDKGAYLQTAAKLSDAERREIAIATRASRKTEASVAKAAVDSIDVSDAEF